MTKTPMFRKKCSECGRPSLYPLDQTTCGITRRLGMQPCKGTLEPYSGDFDDAVFNLLAAARHVQPKSVLLAYAIEDLETWMENSGETPRSMGWVGRDLLP